MLHRETSAYTTAYRRLAVYFYVTNFPIMSLSVIQIHTTYYNIVMIL